MSDSRGSFTRAVGHERYFMSTAGHHGPERGGRERLGGLECLVEGNFAGQGVNGLAAGLVRLAF